MIDYDKKQRIGAGRRRRKAEPSARRMADLTKQEAAEIGEERSKYEYALAVDIWRHEALAKHYANREWE